VTPREAGRGLVPGASPAADPRLAAAERRRREALAAVDTLDAEVERLAGALDDFARRWDAALGASFAALSDAERLVRRLQVLEDELARVAAGLRGGGREGAGRARRATRVGPGGPVPGGAARGRRADGTSGAWRTDGTDDGWRRDAGERVWGGNGDRAPSGDGTEPAGAEDRDEGEPGDAGSLKRLHRRLARLVHPDLAADDEERARLAAWMARVNEAWARRDRAALELIAERIGGGEEAGEVSDADRLAHLEARAAALEGIAASLAAERDRLAATDTHRLLEEARRRAAGGGDLVAETRRDLEAEAAEVRGDARQRLGRLWRAADETGRLWRRAMTGLVRRGGGGLRRFDPLAESPLVRQGAARLARQRAGAAARELARRLEEAAERTPWEAAAVVLAYLAEAAGRPPEALATPAGWADRWALLCETWGDAPDFETLLARPPRHLRIELGLRARTGVVSAGLQLASADLGSGVDLALGREPVARVARAVLAALGPRLRCGPCRRTRLALHVVRTRGLDEVHGLACPSCGAVLRSWWRYGDAEGLEALAPLALRLGLVSEQVVRLGGATLAFQMPARAREKLTAGGLRALFAELYLRPCEIALAPGALQVWAGGKALRASERLPAEGVRLALAPGAGPGERELVEALRARIARRFRPHAGA
jgi:hypothetical protein